MSTVTTWTKRVAILTDYYTGRDFCLWILTSGAAFTLLLLIFSGFDEPFTMIKIGRIMTGIIFLLFTFVAGVMRARSVSGGDERPLDGHQTGHSGRETPHSNPAKQVESTHTPKLLPRELSGRGSTCPSQCPR